ncbi:peroxisomal acyl-coenzyme A oxidase 2-like [Eleutherodactylus coqui]|uniref:peroxisomal acyl-coenzyme A oxidase 2-like n=1 Tax=Eleutherodactylus coqui TaxID=57060 RepID=UPI0034618BBA
MKMRMLQKGGSILSEPRYQGPRLRPEYMYFKTLLESYEGAVRNTLHMRRKIEEMGWDENGREVKYISRNISAGFRDHSHL